MGVLEGCTVWQPSSEKREMAAAIKAIFLSPAFRHRKRLFTFIPSEEKLEQKHAQSVQSTVDGPQTTLHRGRNQKLETCEDEELKIKIFWQQSIISIAPGQLDFGA
jgi:hypothetical protein